MQTTGSEIVLYNLLLHIKSNYSVKLVSIFKGSLLSLLSKQHPTTYIHTKRPANFLEKILFKLKELLYIPALLYTHRKSCWYINTIVLWDYLERAEKWNVQVILHVHEMEQVFALLTKEQLNRVIHYPDLIIANSMYTSQLLQQYGRTKPIELCYPAIDTKKIKADGQIKTTYRKKLSIPVASFVWAMCGTIDDNKNPELFIHVAYELHKAASETTFLWIGNTQDKDFGSRCKKLAEEKNISSAIHWINATGEEYMNYFRCADGFVLTSKKESFSIVTLEALLLGIPVVTHDCGGVKEILKKDVGTIVNEKNNTSQFVQAMLTYMKDYPNQNKTKAIERAAEFDIAIWSEKWNSILTKYVKT